MNNFENAPEFQPIDGVEFAQVMHDRLLCIMQKAKTLDILDPYWGESYDTPQDDDSFFSVAGYENTSPIIIINQKNKLKYLTASIYLYEEYSDIAALGREANGEPAAIMQMNSRAELQSRRFRVFVDTFDNPECVRPHIEGEALVGHEKSWLISFDLDKGWQTMFWKNFKNQCLDDNDEDVDQPSLQDYEEFAAVLTQADLRISDADNSII